MDPLKAQERVLVIPESHFRRVGFFQGFRPFTEDYFAALLDPREFSFRPRGEVESDPSFKQLIPYVVLRCGDQIFHYRRGKAGTETRLQSLRSIGIGGHISEEDGDLAGAYEHGMLRELHEEVDLAPIVARSVIGFIFDDRTPVGSVHLGVVHLFDIESAKVSSREDAIVESGFASLPELLRESESFETWSQFVVAELNR